LVCRGRREGGREEEGGGGVDGSGFLLVEHVHGDDFEGEGGVAGGREGGKEGGREEWVGECWSRVIGKREGGREKR